MREGAPSKNSNLIKYLICSGFKLDPIMKTAAAINRAEKVDLVLSSWFSVASCPDISSKAANSQYRKTGYSLIAGGTAGNKRKESRIMKELHYGLIMDHVLNGS